MKNQRQSSILFSDLSEGDEVRLDGLTFIRVVNIGMPTLKATIDVQILNGEEQCIYNDNVDNWQNLESTTGIVVGIGDKLQLGDISVMMTSLSSSRKTIRLSMRTRNKSTLEKLKRASR